MNSNYVNHITSEQLQIIDTISVTISAIIMYVVIIYLIKLNSNYRSLQKLKKYKQVKEILNDYLSSLPAGKTSKEYMKKVFLKRLQFEYNASKKISDKAKMYDFNISAEDIFNRVFKNSIDRI